jgi:DNA-binding winged helix-turn-helix (wHTH) protein
MTDEEIAKLLAENCHLKERLAFLFQREWSLPGDEKGPHLMPKEVQIAQCLHARPGETITTKQLTMAIYGVDNEKTKTRIRALIHGLRRRLIHGKSRWTIAPDTDGGYRIISRAEAMSRLAAIGRSARHAPALLALGIDSKAGGQGYLSPGVSKPGYRKR